MDLEHRSAIEWRAAGRKLTGTVVKYGVETRIGRFVERVARGAFDEALRSGRDILALVGCEVLWRRVAVPNARRLAVAVPGAGRALLARAMTR